jgi:hypothetical protein
MLNGHFEIGLKCIKIFYAEIIKKLLRVPQKIKRENKIKY